MPYGLRVSNNDGITQIDQDYSNYSLHSSGTVSSGTVIPTPSSSHIILVRPTVTSDLVYYDSLSSTPNRVRSVAESYGSNLPDAGSIKYVVMAGPDEVPLDTGGSSDYGLQVFKSDGGLAYTSQGKYFNIVATCVIPEEARRGGLGGSGVNVTNHTLPAPRPYHEKYFSLLPSGYFAIFQLMPGYSPLIGIYSVSTGRFTSETNFRQELAFPNGPYVQHGFFGTVEYLIADVRL